ncbi:YdbC family protein [Lentibacillus sp. CBA3610]|uniref:YdbC family protein n=1 Tax=Lentibacillus sp. CBA3610 TaxID=2518176 RepID=UPI0020D20A8D|nr:PC4/YdbC family ssDNA-binding protein [Lentibacillus sp. CBA3610]
MQYCPITKKGWTKELNLVSWNGRDPKYDLRDWSPDKAKMGKGVTLTDADLTNLKTALDKLDL